MMMMRLIVVLLAIIGLINANSCDNSCSGHGVCGSNSVCECYEGWGMGLSYDSGDCSERICPFEFAWVDSPDRVGSHHKYVECSAKGICNRDNGECECFPGYEGKGCARTTCPNDCSGHGQCVNLDKEPFKAVIGDYNNYHYAAKYFATSTTPSGNTDESAVIPLNADLISRLIPNDRVVIGSTIYFVKNIADSSISVSQTNAGVPGGSTMKIGAATTTTAFKTAVSQAVLALPRDDLRSFSAVATGGVFTSNIPHGLVVGTVIYLTNIVGTPDATKGSPYVLYSVTTVPQPTTFTLTNPLLLVDGAAQVAGTPNSATDYTAMTVNVIIPSNALTITAAGVPSLNVMGQFDVVDPVIPSLTTYIDKRYWDAKKSRGCVCDPEYGDVDCSARMCQYGTDVMNTHKDLTVAAKNQIQLVSLKGTSDYAGSFVTGTKGKTFALTFKTKVNETFSTIPINMPVLIAATTVVEALAAIRNFELDVEWALKNLPSAVIDNVKVHVTKPVDTTLGSLTLGVYASDSVRLASTGAKVTGGAAGSIGGATSGHDVFEFSVEFSGNNVQGTQRYLTVQAATCGAGCYPKIDGLPINSVVNGNTDVTVTTLSTVSTGMDNDMESDLNSYECGRRGKCDYKTGLCTCFSGYTGLSCNVITALV